MNFNPAAIMQLINAKKTFDKNHPKVNAYVSAVQQQGIKEGAIIQLKITNPDSQPLLTNIKVQESDLELLKEIGDLIKGQM